jgi:hypothetical protein
LAILNGEPHSLPQLEWFEASNMLSFLLRTAWDSSICARGLRPYEMANGRKAWFPAVGYTSDGWTKYSDIRGVERRKRLVGRSAKRKVHWHFALEAWPSIGREPRIALKPHVVFTEDGRTPLADHKRMHQLRRGFCRSWWNPRWRDLMLAYTTLISNKSGSIELPVGSKQSFRISDRPMTFEAPVTLRTLRQSNIREDETDAELDALTDDLEWEGDDESDGAAIEDDEG